MVDEAEALVTSQMPRVGREQLEDQIQLADRELRRLGITTVHDAGADGETVDAYKRLIESGRIKTRLYVMLRGTLRELAPPSSAGRRRMSRIGGWPSGRSRSTRMARLGSRGAALLEPYSDEQDTSGLADHAAGRGVRTDAGSGESWIPGRHTCHRRSGQSPGHGCVRAGATRGARLARAADAHRARADSRCDRDPTFRALGVIASMQPTHATSDMPWAATRIGNARIEEGAYVWRKLLDAGAVFASGSDFPVEEANPMLGLYAAITRQDSSGNPAGRWMPRQRMTREEALASLRRTPHLPAMPRRTPDRSYQGNLPTWLSSRATSCASRRERS